MDTCRVKQLNSILNGLHFLFACFGLFEIDKLFFKELCIMAVFNYSLNKKNNIMNQNIAII